MLDGLICVYRSNVDLYFYVMGSANENEVFLDFDEDIKGMEGNHEVITLMEIINLNVNLKQFLSTGILQQISS